MADWSCYPKYPDPHRPWSVLTVPEYPGAQTVSSDETSGVILDVLYKTDADSQTVTDFYEAELPKYGWQEDPHPPVPRTFYVLYGHSPDCWDLFALRLAVTGSDGGTLISVKLNLARRIE